MTINKKRIQKLESKTDPQGPAKVYVIHEAEDGAQAAAAKRAQAATDPNAIIFEIVHDDLADIHYPGGRRSVRVGIDLDQI